MERRWARCSSKALMPSFVSKTRVRGFFPTKSFSSATYPTSSRVERCEDKFPPRTRSIKSRPTMVATLSLSAMVKSRSALPGSNAYGASTRSFNRVSSACGGTGRQPHATATFGRYQQQIVEHPTGMIRNGGPAWSGILARHAPESVAGMERNTHSQLCRCLRILHVYFLGSPARGRFPFQRDPPHQKA